MRLFFLSFCVIATLGVSFSGCKTSVTPSSSAVQADSICTYTPTEQRLKALGLVDVATLDSGIAVHLIYATPYNFMGKVLYKELNHAFLLPDVAKRLIEAKRRLKAIRPDLNFLIYDAVRPISVQREMWRMVEHTEMRDFVMDPTTAAGSHNLGNAVDLTLMDCTGQPVPMGSCYDYFGDEARTVIEDQLLAEGRITRRELDYRLLLRRVMGEEGFTVYPAEWWHFDAMPLEQARKMLKPIE
ncbi:MAG: M15 family metallopeptidase [Alistipes sp.]|nr:M15 family metallopeptidase [Alistipes sp.]